MPRQSQLPVRIHVKQNHPLYGHVLCLLFHNEFGKKMKWKINYLK